MSEHFGVPDRIFTVHEPRGKEIPVVVEIPHAGLGVDTTAMATLSAPARAIGNDADLYVDDLYERAPLLGASMLVSHISRYVCDLNRGEGEVDARSVAGSTGGSFPHGLIWRRTTDDQPALVAPLSGQELQRRLQTIYHPYHRALADLVSAKLTRFGHVVVLCAHSMPSRGRPGHRDSGTERADIVPGSRGGRTAAPLVIQTPELLATERGWSVTHDDPYRGGYTTGLYGRPSQDVHAVQVELARRLYMDESTLRKKEADFPRVAAYCDALVERLGSLQLK